MGGKELFPITSGLPTEQTIQRKFQYQQLNLHVIETVGLDEMRRSREEVLTELTTAVLMAADAGGVNAFLICVNLGSEPMFSYDVATALEDLEAMKTIWSRAILLFMNAKVNGESVEQRTAAVNELIRSPRCPGTLRWLLDKVGELKVLFEYDDVDHQTDVDSIMTWTEAFKLTQGIYTNPMMQEAKGHWEEYKLDIQKMGKNVPDKRTPYASYRELASWITENSWKVASRTRPFSQIFSGIQESRRKRQEAITATPPSHGSDFFTY